MMSTRQFVSYFPDFCIQTFKDSKNIKGKYDFCKKPSAFGKEELKELNAKGVGIFFSPNRFSTGRRKIIYCEGINAWFADLDEESGTIAEQEKKIANSPLEPSFVVRSKNGHHLYWLAKDAKIANFDTIIRDIIAHFTSDPNCKDVSRVLRLPLFLHCKDMFNQDVAEEDRTFVVHLIKENPELLYTDLQMLEHFPYFEPIKEEYKPKEQIDSTDFWTVLGSLDNMMMLKKLSGHEIVNKETFTFSKRNEPGTFYIDVNGKSSGGWFDAQGMIGSGSQGGPTWIQWITYYGRTKGEIALWCKENIPELLPEETNNNSNKTSELATKLSQNFDVESPKDLEEELREKLNKPKSEYTWGDDIIDYKFPIIEKGEGYIILYGQSGSGKTLWALWMAKQIAKNLKKVMFLSLEMTKIQILFRYCVSKAGVDKEQYRARSYDTEEVMKHSKDLNNITFLGIEKGEEYTIEDIDRIITEEQPSILFIDNFNKISSKEKDELSKDIAVSKQLLNLNRKHRIPIIVIHHANKTPPKSNKDTKINLRGLSGMRGSQKIIDDADIAIEIARPAFDDTTTETKVNNICHLAVYKDRLFDSKCLLQMKFNKGDYHHQFDGLQEDFL